MGEKDDLYSTPKGITEPTIKKPNYEDCYYCGKTIENKQKIMYWNKKMYHRNCFYEQKNGKQTSFKFGRGTN